MGRSTPCLCPLLFVAFTITPPFPSFPYQLPFSLPIDLGKVLQIPQTTEPGCGCMTAQACPCCVKAFLDCLLQKGGHEGCSYVINLNYKVFVLKWRDGPPRGPWTRQVWDIYQVMPNSCGGCETLRHLGWQWCWADVIKTLRSEVFRQWVNTWPSGAGGLTVLTGQTSIQDAQVVVPQIGPVLWLDGADLTSFELDGSNVVRWFDKSGRLAHAVSTPGSRPTRIDAILGDQGVVDFTPGQFFLTPTKAQQNTHIFALMRYRGGGDTLGTIFAATGLEVPFGGPDLKIRQTGLGQGSLVTFVGGQERVQGLLPITPSSFVVVELAETMALEGEVRLGSGGVLFGVFGGNSQTDLWDPTKQTFGQSVPIRASIGRAAWGINPAKTFDLLDGQIAELLVYSTLLGDGQRIQVHNALREKWGLGPPLVLA